MKLNEDQMKLINKIEKIGEDNEFLKVIFTGSAGTGKTTTVIEAIKKIKEKKLKLMILTPTHQSGIVIQKMLEKNNLKEEIQKVQTIHSYFEISPDINDKGERKFIPKIKDIDINADIFIIDEVSMINKEILNIILNKLKLKHVVFIGDRYQLPPVKEQFSPVFNLPYEKITLEKIMRMEDNLESFEKIRNLIKKYEEENYVEDLENIYNILSVFKIYEEAEFPNFFNLYVNKRFNEKLNIKIGSFTNNFVDYYNLHFRNFDTEVEDKNSVYSKGDKLLLNSPFNFLMFDSKDTLTERFFFAAPNILKNGEEIKVEEAREVTLKLEKIFEIKKVYNRIKEKTYHKFVVLPEKLKKMELSVNLIKSEDNKIFLTTASEETKKFIEELFELAKEYTLVEKNKNQRKKFWSLVYSISDKIINVNYAYASTIHKLQGQTLDDIFIDVRDFMHLYKNDYNLFLRLLYVGITRTSNQVYILK